MTTSFIYVPFPRDLYDDIIRFSGGKVDPVEIAIDQLRTLIRFGLEDGSNNWFGDRDVEFATIHFPDLVADWKQHEEERTASKLASLKPLVWKEISVPAHSEVRMQYGGLHHYGKVRDGLIQDNDGSFSPSEWASKIADNTSRNAWRDISFKFPGTSRWIHASILRQQAKNSVEEF